MDDATRSAITDATLAAAEGKAGAVDRLLRLVYPDLKEAAHVALRRERKDHTLQTTALVHEAYLRLVDQERVDWKGRTHFLAVSAQAMRRILVDHARGKHRDKRGGDVKRADVDLEANALSPHRSEDVLAVDELLDELAAADARQARILELRFFGGLTVAETADALGVSKRTVEAEWTMVRAWLRRELSRERPKG